MEHLADESTDLKLHTHLCAERYKGIQEQFVHLESRIKKVEDKIDELKQDYNDGNRSLKNTLITTGGSILVALIGVIGVVLMQ
jgi:uncharacterized protein (DUF342 family)